MLFSLTFSLDENDIKVHDNKDVKLFCQDLIDVALKYDWYVSQTKKYYLILKITIMNPESYLSFIIFLDPHPIIGIS